MSGSRSATSLRAPWEGPSLLSSLVCERREPLNPGIWLKAPHFPAAGGSQRELEHSPSQSIVKTQIPLILTWSGGPAPPAGSQRCPAGSWELRLSLSPWLHYLLEDGRSQCGKNQGRNIPYRGSGSAKALGQKDLPTAFSLSLAALLTGRWKKPVWEEPGKEHSTQREQKCKGPGAERSSYGGDVLGPEQASAVKSMAH
ncbi:uncharacterized protein LOC118663508 isoform X2 [Myotis myotis]|uniref:Uncharacterized protein n=1 Tax=Myotis myotis TaxID=51298 RepID=A0A7J7VYP1_MYOMY|nr:uncharacterized protein LOC118663508 isoform X2 [Myotis myotis]KAF6330252.1 hypothetical protein mMyoMyo1_012250 [Myotis myotis]